MLFQQWLNLYPLILCHELEPVKEYKRILKILEIYGQHLEIHAMFAMSNKYINNQRAEGLISGSEALLDIVHICKTNVC